MVCEDRWPSKGTAVGTVTTQKRGILTQELIYFFTEFEIRNHFTQMCHQSTSKGNTAPECLHRGKRLDRRSGSGPDRLHADPPAAPHLWYGTPPPGSSTLVRQHNFKTNVEGEMGNTEVVVTFTSSKQRHLKTSNKLQLFSTLTTPKPERT